MSLPKILIAAPTAKSKNYCFESWIKNVLEFTYPHFTITLFDNTIDDGANAALLNYHAHQNLIIGNKFWAINSFVTKNGSGHLYDGVDSIFARMAISHQDCRQTAIEGDFDYLLHLETDVFPQADIIEKLLEQQKDVIGAVYYIDQGKYRKPMILKLIEAAPNGFNMVKMAPNEDIGFMDGTIKRVGSVGLGCVLISKKVLQQIPFRSNSGEDAAPDTFFALDCFKKKIDIYAHTGCVARHDNRPWGIYGTDFK